MKSYYKGSYPVPTKDKYLCKKYYKHYSEYTDSKVEFFVGKFYDVLEIQQGPTIVMKGIYFFCGKYPPDSRPYIYDYFCTEQEERKLKLKRINESIV
jgi:hypothetical protein